MKNKENTYSSPKLHLIYVTMILIFGGALLSAWMPAFSGNYATMVGALLGAAGIYTGGHVSSTWVMGNNEAKMAAVDVPEDEEDEPKGYLHPHKDPGIEE
jgi:hypothetical protein